MVTDLGECGERSDRESLVGFVDTAQSGDVSDIDKLLGLIDATLHPVEQIDSTCFHDSAVFQLRQSAIDGCAICNCEVVHAKFLSAAGLRSAARTTDGVMGVWRMRTPMAL